MGQGRPRDLDRLLDHSDRHLPPALHQQEENLQPTEMSKRFECLDVRLIGGQLRQRQASDRLHISKYMKLSNPCQVPCQRRWTKGRRWVQVAGRESERAGSECGMTTVGAISGSVGTSQRKSPVAAAAPSSCATMNAGASTGRIPANVSLAARARVTAGVANDVEAVNQLAAV